MNLVDYLKTVSNYHDEWLCREDQKNVLVIDVDSDFRVRKSDGSVIQGLFAVGEALGAAATMGKSFCGGLLAMPAIGFARLIAQAI